jgi:hypothetical protein
MVGSGTGVQTAVNGDWVLDGEGLCGSGRQRAHSEVDIRWKADPAETGYGGAVDVKRAADLYAQGWTLRQIGAELGVPWTAVGNQLRRAGVTMRRGGPPAHPAPTQQILELREPRPELDRGRRTCRYDSRWCLEPPS